MKKEKKKGFFSAIMESMKKTGGCCGSGESCCGPAVEPDAPSGDDAGQAVKAEEK